MLVLNFGKEVEKLLLSWIRDIISQVSIMGYPFGLKIDCCLDGFEVIIVFFRHHIDTFN